MEFQITKAAIKSLKRLDARTRDRILSGIYKLPDGDIKRLQGYTSYYRLRIGDFRIIYTCKANIITVAAVLPRGEVYKHI